MALDLTPGYKLDLTPGYNAGNEFNRFLINARDFFNGWGRTPVAESRNPYVPENPTPETIPAGETMRISDINNGYPGDYGAMPDYQSMYDQAYSRKRGSPCLCRRAVQGRTSTGRPRPEACRKTRWQPWPNCCRC